LPDGLSKDSDRPISTYIIVLMSVSCTILIVALIYLLYRKYKNKTVSKNVKIKYNGPIREVWSNPDMDNMPNIISLDKNNNSTRLNSNTNTSHKSDMVEFSK
jgi:hypothetical protein